MVELSHRVEKGGGRCCRSNPHNKQNKLIGLNGVHPRAVEELEADEPCAVQEPGRENVSVPCNTQSDADSKYTVQNRQRGVQPQNQNAGNMNKNNTLGKSKRKS